MRRLHLIEIMDQKWCPDHVRDGITDYLRWFEHFWNIYQPIFPRLKQVLEELRSERIIDLCSGGGGPWVNFYRELDDLKECAPMVYLTDLYPNGSALEVSRNIFFGRILFCSEPVSATNVPTHLTGFRTLFSAFHHFSPPMAKSILRDAVRSSQGIAIFEISRRTPLMIALMCFSPLLVIFSTPFITPFRWWRLFWTYLVPAIPFAFTFDAISSCLRTYSPQELRELTEEIAVDGYHWESGIQPLGCTSFGITYLIGYPIPEKHTVETV
ncbi:MAG: hypothetical protein C0399_02200 [Syntrophus sp. (in: bacteria)]|nr:hypothetical protein [Syntrophus sp. (in: bacteria)]